MFRLIRSILARRFRICYRRVHTSLRLASTSNISQYTLLRIPIGPLQSASNILLNGLMHTDLSSARVARVGKDHIKRRYAIVQPICRPVVLHS